MEECRANGAILLDVRTKEEFSGGHIEGAVNLPLDRITQAEELFPNFSAPLYVYCRSGARSSQATAMLQQMANQNPQVRQFMQMINGKSPQQLENITRNAARERGVNLEDLMKQFGLR